MCLTCDIVNGKIVPVGGIIYQDDWVILHQCLDVNIPGYIIISSMRHVEGYDDLNDSELFRIGIVSRTTIQILKELQNVEKVYIANLGEETAHFHWHLFPRYNWMLTRHTEDICTANKIDGAKLFSLCREKYKVPLDRMNQPDILNTIAATRNRLRSKACPPKG